jgi:competence protein ComEC
MEQPAIETLLEWYKDTPTLNADVYEIGHHGSHNGTTSNLVEAITPRIAVISRANGTTDRIPQTSSTPGTMAIRGRS